jgi:hypothetical protein
MTRVKQYDLPKGKVGQHLELDDLAELARRMGPRARLQIKATGSKDGPLQVVYWAEDREVTRATVRESERKHLGQVLHQLLDQVGHTAPNVANEVQTVDFVGAIDRAIARDLNKEEENNDDESAGTC